MWNPSTIEFKVIPHDPFDFVPNWEASANHHGFGHDSVRNDYYKVMRHVVFCCRTDHDLDAHPNEDISYHSLIWETYNLRSNSWRKHDVNMPHTSMDCVQFYIDGFSNRLCKSEIHNEGYSLSSD